MSVDCIKDNNYLINGHNGEVRFSKVRVPEEWWQWELCMRAARDFIVLIVPHVIYIYARAPRQV
jgi:hypothetical protein